jgi:predicted nuclease of predicted toxin-antitoxin system
MRPGLLAKENFPAPSVAVLRAAGFDALFVAESDGGADCEMMKRAVAEHRWILTFGRDCGELICRHGLPAPPAAVLLRLKSYSPQAPGRFLAGLLASGFEAKGGLIVRGGNVTVQAPPQFCFCQLRNLLIVHYHGLASQGVSERLRGNGARSLPLPA